MKNDRGLRDLLRDRKLSPMPHDVRAYTSSIEFDVPIAKHVIDINKTHALMLARRNIVSREDAAMIIEALGKVSLEGLPESEHEDVHIYVEASVIDMVGDEVGGKIHTAKSRNDQVATALRMEVRSNLLNLLEIVIGLRKTLLKMSLEYSEAVMVGYTHLQHAQPVTLGHHILAHHDALERDTWRLKDLYPRVNLSPMGSGALATTSFDIDRAFMAEILGFEGLIENSIDAVSARDFAVEAIADYAMISIHLSRLAEELVLWSTSEFSSVKIDDAYVSTSSIMPQKRNPEVAELIRARTAHTMGDLLSALAILKGLPLSYNSDLQEVTPHLWRSYRTALDSARMLAGILEGLEFNLTILYERAAEGFSFATDIADMLVSRFKLPFRTAHNIVGTLVHRITSEGKDISSLTIEALKDEVEKSTGERINIESGDWRNIFRPECSVHQRAVTGGPSPREVVRMCREKEKRIVKDEEWVNKRLVSLKEAEERMEKLSKKLVGGESLGG